MATAVQQKHLGAFYTSARVADFLVKWSVRNSDDSVLDPSCGDGVFLSAAIDRLQRLGAQRPAVWGVDVDSSAIRAVASAVPSATARHADFFEITPRGIPSFSVVVGNPPFIRYQTFNGSRRLSALDRAKEAGIRLTGLSSSWAPFLIHATEFLRFGGRLGMVAPVELAHAGYARSVISFLLTKFAKISVRMFHEKLFPELSEDTVLLLCEGYGTACQWLSVTFCRALDDAALEEQSVIPVDIEAIRSGKRRLNHYLVPTKALHLYDALSEQSTVNRLGDVGSVGIGYVTGCNEFFHLSRSEVTRWRLPRKALTPAWTAFGKFRGLTFQSSDWQRLRELDRKVYLLRIKGTAHEIGGDGLARYLTRGVEQGIHRRFKCRVRHPWYAVPHVKIGHAFLTYMSGKEPRLALNAARVVAPNTLHLVNFAKPHLAKHFAIGWWSSLTRLSCELEGHALGGGMLKLEPSEAEAVRIAVPNSDDRRSLHAQLDRALRSGADDAAVQLVDTFILRKGLGLSANECATLRAAAWELENRRMHR